MCIAFLSANCMSPSVIETIWSLAVIAQLPQLSPIPALGRWSFIREYQISLETNCMLENDSVSLAASIPRVQGSVCKAVEISSSPCPAMPPLGYNVATV